MALTKKQLLLLVFAGLQTCQFSFIPSTIAMEELPRTPLKNSVLFNPNIQPELIVSLTRAHDADQASVALDSFILSDKEIVELLIKINAKHPKSITIHVHESNTHNKKSLELLTEAGVPFVLSRQHAKRLAIAFKNNNENEWHRHSFMGSYNLTANARKNKELMVKSVSDSPDHQAHNASHTHGTKRDRTKTASELIDITPDKKLVIDNTTHDLHGSIARRIDHTEQGDTLYFGSMNYGDPVIHAALLKAALRKVLVNILLDTDAAAQKNVPMLDALVLAGAHVVFPTGKVRTNGTENILAKSGIFHQKYLVRLKHNNALAYVSTANATEHAQDDFNVSTFYPEETELAQALVQSHTELAKAGITYQAFKASGAKLPQRSKPKNLFTVNNSNN